MSRRKKLFPIIVVALMTLLLLVTVAPAAGTQPEPQELFGLRESPGRPVRSIFLRRDFPDHPRGGPPGQGQSASSHCDKDIDLTSTIKGMVVVDTQDNGICTNADIDTYVNTVDGDVYVVQGGGQEAAVTISHIDANGNATLIQQLFWSQPNTYTPDAKAFVQGGRNYVALSLERTSQFDSACGVVFMDVTDSRGASPPLPPIVHQEIGADWCDVHNAFVENISGEGRYVYLTADGPNDVRVLDIANIATTDPPEIGRYTSPTANTNNYVHDVTVLDHGGSVGRRVYLSYWDSGLVLLDAADMTPGTNPTPLIGPNVIDPPGFLNHHAFGSQDGNQVIFQDEIDGSVGFESVQMWDISNTSSPFKLDSLVLGTDVPVFASHNLEIRYDIDPNRVYIGWYKLGVEAWDFTSSGFTRDTPSDGRNSVVYHQAQTEAADGAYDGAWAVRLAQIGSNLFIFQSDRGFGLIVDCIGTCIVPPTDTPTATNTPGANQMHVENIDMAVVQEGGPWYHAEATVTIFDAGGMPVNDATVFGSFTGDSSSSDSGNTNASGQVTLTSSRARNGTDWTFCVDNVTKSGWTYDSGANVETCDSTGGPTATPTPTSTPGGPTDTPTPTATPGTGSGTIKGTVYNTTGGKEGGVLVSVDTGEDDTTNNGGKYNITSVPAGMRTVTATKTGFTCDGPFMANLGAGQTVTQDFDCTPD